MTAKQNTTGQSGRQFGFTYTFCLLPTAKAALSIANCQPSPEKQALIRAAFSGGFVLCAKKGISKPIRPDDTLKSLLQNGNQSAGETKLNIKRIVIKHVQPTRLILSFTMKNSNEFIKKHLNNIICNDALTALEKFPDESIDCVITSTHYWSLRDYGVRGQIGLEADFNDYLDKLIAIFDEVKRVLKSTGDMLGRVR